MRAAAALLACTAVAAGAKTHAKPPRAQPLSKPTWLDHVVLSEYYPVPESWFSGRAAPAPGLADAHRIDWLYSAAGVAMEGDGIDLAGHLVHVDALGSGGWINADGKRTKPRRDGGWTRGDPFWRAGGYWLDAAHKPTFPLASGDWSAGPGRRYVRPRGISFAPGPSRPLHYYESIAVDPRLIPLGSHVYIPSYRGIGGSDGWFVAADTGGAILGRHIDIYRPPPDNRANAANSSTDARVYVVPPGSRAPAEGPTGPTEPSSPTGGVGPPSGP